MNKLLLGLREELNDTEFYSEIVDELKNGQTSGLSSDNYYWEFEGTVTDEVLNAILLGQTEGDGWSLNIDSEASDSLEDYPEAVVALLSELGELDTIDEIEYDENPVYGDGYHVTFDDGREYSVYVDYDEAESAAKESLESLIDDLGAAEAFRVDTLIDFLDEDFFREIQENDFEYFASELSDSELLEELQNYNVDISDYVEPIETTEEDEEVDYGTIDTDELTIVDRADAENALVDQMKDYRYRDNPIDWYRDTFGDSALADLIRQQGDNVLDIEALTSWAVDVDGPANELARYDGRELECDYNGRSYYAYRTD